MDIPIFIVNRDRLTTTKNLVEWLLDAGHKQIIIVDNDSSYLPLLEWYKTLSNEVNVKMMNSNTGPGIVWDAGLSVGLETPYVVSDSDLIPTDYCPQDVVTHLLNLLEVHTNYNKIGVGLRIDNIPDNVPWKNSPMIQLQSQFWKERYSDNCFKAAVDTTFAIYRKDNVDSQPGSSLRTDIPYVFEHVPWYIWPLTEEEKYYHNHANHWSSIKWWKNELVTN